MKKYKCYAFLLAISGVLIAPVMSAQEKEVQPIGIVNMQFILEKSSFYQKEMEQLQKELNKKELQSSHLVKEYTDAVESFKKEGPLLSEDRRSRKERELMGMRRSAERAQQDLHEESMSRQQEVSRRFFSKVRELLKQIGKEEQYMFILESEAALYVDPHYDITPKVLKRLAQAG